MLQIQRGTVKFFHREKGWGFITPLRGGKDVYFHVKYYSGVSEKYYGELELLFAADSTLVGEYRTPEKGDEILYQPSDVSPKGLMAIHWLYPETFLQAEKMLAERTGDPANFLVRVTRYGPEEMESRAPQATVLWNGDHNEYDKKLDEGFPEMHDQYNAAERLKIDGKWHRMWHPSCWHEKFKKQAQVA